ncbi:hypothetical protein P3S67_020702 [Capsicum chacoense]
MALKVVMVLFLAMLVFTEHNAMADERDAVCLALCILRCQKRPVCLTRRLASCAIIGNTNESVDTEAANQNHVCNVGCSLGHCSKFLVQYGIVRQHFVLLS